jgi:hypothetical protein
VTKAFAVAAFGVLATAALKIAAGGVAWLAGYIEPAQYPGAFPPWVHAVHVVIFSGAGVLLITGGRADARPRRLGALFLLLAASFSDRLVAAVAVSPASGGAAAAVASVMALLQPEAFVPFVAWRFVKDFPRVEAAEVFHRPIVIGTSAALVVGSLLFAANVFPLPTVRNVSPLLAAWLAPLHREPREASVFWQTLILLVLPAFLLMLRKIPMSARAERRRVGMFVGGLVGGAAPMMILVILESLFRPFASFMDQPDRRLWSGVVCYSMLLSVPLTTGYAVLVGRVMDVRLVIRKAIRYSLARLTILVALVLPVLGVCYAVYVRRDRTIGELLGGWNALALGAMTLLCLALFRARRPVLEALDRRFFRDQYDARLLLAAIAERARSADDLHGFAEFVGAEIDRALHVERITFLVVEPDRELLTSPLGGTAPLPLSAPLITLLSGDTTPLELDLSLERSALRRLSQIERDWVTEHNFQLLVPLIGNAGTLVGAIALGPRKSEQPFSSSDRLLLSTVAAAVALTLENRALRSRGTPAKARGPAEPTPAERAADPRVAEQCDTCGLVHPPGALRCAECAGRLVPASLPERLNEFQVQRLIGAGGMGVVYVAKDRGLNRAVSLKTLPQVSADRVRRLRREAQAMASLQHPHLATIYGLETWKETPILVVEYFPHGTLADRLRRGRLSVREVSELGLHMTAALQYLHNHRLLHRDIKPSNIGLTGDDVPKLLDFGLARVIGNRLPALLGNAADSTVTDAGAVPADIYLTRSHQIVGTVAYLPPEAVRGEPPSVAFDLWSLSVTLYEALTGTNPFRRSTVYETVNEIVTREAPDVRQIRPDCPAALAELLADCLRHDSGRRPGSADVLTVALASCVTVSGR